MTEEKVMDVLIEDLDKEVLKRMPLWFRILREAYAKRTRQNFIARFI